MSVKHRQKNIDAGVLDEFSFVTPCCYAFAVDTEHPDSPNWNPDEHYCSDCYAHWRRTELIETTDIEV